jgi:tape measure domain-containing protein
MPNDDAKLLVRLEAVTTGLERKLKAADRQLAGFVARTKTRTSEMDADLERLGSRFGINITSRGTVIAATIAAVGVALRNTIGAGEKFNQLEGRFEALTGSAERSGALMKGLLDIASRTGVEFDGLAGGVTRFTIAAEAIGATDAEVLQLTENIAKLGAIGGGTTQEIAAGAQQLGQALASGRLQGDEFRSIMENLPLVARTLADNLNVSVEQLREMSREGRLTSEEVFSGLLEGSEAINAQFEKLPASVERATNRMQTAFLAALARINENIGATNVWTGALENVAVAAEEVARIGFNAALEQGLKAIDADIRRFFGQSEAQIAAMGLLSGPAPRKNAGTPNNFRIIDELIRKREDEDLAAFEKPFLQAIENQELKLKLAYEALGRSRSRAPDTPPTPSPVIGASGGGSVEELSRTAEDIQRIFDETRTAAERYAEELAKLDALRPALGEDTYARAVAKLNDELHRVNPALTAVQGSFENLFDNILSGAEGASDALRNLAVELAKIALKQALVSGLPGIFGAGGILAIPGFANGTNYAPGGLSLVGERGPELVRIPRGAQVIPNHRLGGGGVSVQIINNTDARISQRQERGPDGATIMRVLVDEVRADVMRGGFDRAMGVRFGATPSRVTR